MLKKAIPVAGVALLVLAGIALLSGCAAEPEVTEPEAELTEPEAEVSEENQVRSYADLMTENILLAINADDYVKYSEHFDDAMKNALPEAIFQQSNNLIKVKIGDYIAKEFWKIETQNQFNIVYYKAKFTREPEDVIVKVVFQEIAGEMYVSGLWFNSPNLQK